MKKPTISVIIPMFNSELYVKESIKSILNQTFQEFEIIVIDDNSLDNSIKIVKSIKDNRIRLFKNSGKNMGSAFCRNLGIEKAKGKYIALLDSDDISLKKRLQIQYDFMEKNPNIGVCSSWYKSFGISHRVHKNPTNSEKIKIHLLFHTLLCQSASMIRLSILKKHNIRYNESFKRSQDFEIWNRLKNFTNFYNIPKVLLYRRTHKKQVTYLKNTFYSDKVREINRNNILKRLKILSNEQDTFSNNILFSFTEIKNKRDFKLLQKWIDFLIIKNKQVNLYSDRIFTEILYNRFWRICKTYGMIGARAFFKSTFLKRIDIDISIRLKSFFYGFLPIKRNKHKI